MKRLGISFCIKLLDLTVFFLIEFSANLQELQQEERRQLEEIKAQKEDMKHRCLEKQDKVTYARCFLWSFYSFTVVSYSSNQTCFDQKSLYILVFFTYFAYLSQLYSFVCFLILSEVMNSSSSSTMLQNQP